MADVWAVGKWWFWLEVIGLAAWPLVWRLFRPFPDRGYALAKPFGLLVWGYLLWLGATIGALPNTFGGALAALCLVAVIGVWLARPLEPVWAWMKAHWRRMAFVDGLFTLTFIAWAYVRGQSPDITTAGGEKFMEIAFLNGILTSRRFPPHDPWLAGYAISYYYFGYVMVAGLVQLAHVPASVGFNTGFASWFALTFTAAFGLGWAWIARLWPEEDGDGVVRAAGWGLVTALVLTLVGNLEGFLEVLYARRLLPVAFWQWLDIRSINVPYNPAEPASWVPRRFIWWWQASRVIHDRDLLGNTMEVIDEFPAFSFILGDMHPHVLVLPFTLLTLAWTWNVFAQLEADLLAARHVGWRQWQWPIPFSWPATGLTAFLLGGLAFLNTWDFPIYWLLVVALLFLRSLWHTGRGPARALQRALGEGIALAVLGVGLYFPFYLTLQSQASGLLPNLFNPTRMPQFLVMFGPQAALLGLLWWQLGRPQRWKQAALWAIGLWILSWAFVGLLVVGYTVTPAGQAFLREVLNNPVVQENVGGRSLAQLLAFVGQRRIANPWTFLVLGFLLAWTAALIWERGNRTAPQAAPREELFALLLTALGLVLTYAVEFVYIRDLFGTRMNTVFKFYYQAWVVWSLAGVWALARWTRSRSGLLRGVGVSFVALVLALGMLYTVLAIPARSQLRYAGPTLDGEAWIAMAYPDDYELIRWVRSHTRPDDIVLEAPGGSYTFFGRVAAFTGRPTLMGWEFHEWQWRGAALEAQAGTRVADVERIYTRAEGPELLEILRRYGVRYLVVGTTEREKYALTPAREKVFAETLEKVWEKGTAAVYLVP